MKRILIATFTSLAFATPVLAKPLAPSTLVPQTPSTGPFLSQLGSTKAYVPMKHASESISGNTSFYHVLATKSGNLNMKVKIGMKCPTGRTVNYLAYILNGEIKTVVSGTTKAKSYDQTITIQPFSLKDFEEAGQQVFGGWVGNNPHPNHEKIVKKTLKKSIPVQGRCSGLATQVKSFPVTVTVTFEDKDFHFVPPG
ncbi:MAG: hypothetical protein QNJ49_14305 [Mastigocoleus sp. MO_167.B18]|uniref:hypothetical protein n=1 Tax=Mastigocoleus sp. MO_188.B34 TaxID=3036635 RepID=UPI0026275625|nr:hypothetical protein [Mastigocoleus sp. MO_188.B34]MDJ0697624.1 hypothetical protein [Mastigocoleus sp. MO_188.B34]MDJ0774571.1 hypothetical protein [Mastigocoleus sp. MO_167.B18]